MIRNFQQSSTYFMMFRTQSISYLLFLIQVFIAISKSWCFHTMITQFAQVGSIDFSLDNTRLLALDKVNKQLNIWSVDTFQLLKKYKMTDNPTTAKFSKLGDYIGIGFVESNVVILNGNDYSVFNTLISPLGEAIVEIDFSWKGNNIAICGAAQFRFRSFANAGTWSLSNFRNGVSCKLSKDDDLGIATNNAQNSRRQLFWYAYGQNNKALTIAEDQDTGHDSIYQVDFSMEQKSSGTAPRLMATTDNNDEVIAIHQTDRNNVRQVKSNLNNRGKAICQSRNNKFLAVGDSNGRFYILNVENRVNDTYQIFRDTTTSINHCRFSHNNKYLAAGDSAGRIFIYTVNCFPAPCSQGHYYSASETCLPCSSMAECLDCTSPTNCIACVQNYFLQGGVCKNCSVISNCISCESASVCKECKQGYYLNATFGCVECRTVVPGCLSCSANSTWNISCETCTAYYYLNATDKLCYPCVINDSSCVSCLSPSVCLSCAPRYYLSAASSCERCPSRCLTCTNNSACIECVKGFHANSSSGQVCQACSTNCLDCYNSGACKVCVPGTFMNSTGNCNNCSYPCITCNTTSFCETCAPGFYKDGSGGCLFCSNRCLTCASETYCLTCELGYDLLWNNTCSLCSNNHTNCISCNQTSCLACEVGFYLTTARACESCVRTLVACSSCWSSTICQQCHPGHYLAGSLCTPCSSACESCINSTLCTNCALGYFLSSTSCVLCPAACVTCTSNSDCLSCTVGFYLNSTTAPRGCLRCNEAISGCLSCNSSTYCLECAGGQFLSALNRCSVCPGNCSRCNITQCLDCPPGFYLSSNWCLKCSENCSDCSSLTVCSSCGVGYFLNSSMASHNCLSCSGRGCLTCNLNGCLSCEVGKYLNGFSCPSCNSSLSNCLVCSESGCKECSYGLFLTAVGCSSCIGNITGCIACNNSTACLECASGYYLSAGLCSVCAPQCQSCVNNLCSSCKAGYFFNAAGQTCLLCESFLNGCQLCTSNSTCLDCIEGFFLSGSQCKSCRTNLLGCLSCANETHCGVCQEGYFSSNGFCSSCSEIPSCSFCVNATKCISCLSGYYVNGDGCSLCTVTLPGCLLCANVSSCSHCQSGYYLSLSLSQCISCSNTLQGCVRCANDTGCTQCEGGYYLDSSTLGCQPCNQKGCQMCSNTSPSLCSKCSLGFYLSASSCLACPQVGCLECLNSTDCLRCDSGYYQQGSLCLGCKGSITACSKCVDNATCLQCDSLFYLNSSNACESCSLAIPSCELCSSSTACTTCKSGYYPSAGICRSCSTIQGCFMCANATYCLSCFKGFYMSAASLCAACSSVLSNCYECASPSVCLSCSSGFLLDTAGNCQAVVVESRSAYDPVPMLEVKTYYVDASTLKHVLSAKQGHHFKKAVVTWNLNTAISLFNAQLGTTTTLVISRVEWGSDGKSIDFFTDNPLSLDRKSIEMPMMRLLLAAEDLSFSYQTRFSMTKEALSLLLPNVIFANGFTQSKPLMEPGFYKSFVDEGEDYHFTIICYVIVALLAVSLLIKATCTAASTGSLGDCVPHVLALKTCALAVYPVYVQVANFCYGLMAADLPWLTELYSSHLCDNTDASPYGYQLFFDNMNFASMQLTAFLFCLLLLGLGLLFRSTKNSQSKHKIFELNSTSKDQPLQNKRTAFMKAVYIFFSFGLTFAGCSSLVGILYNPLSYFSINGCFYIIGTLVFIVQLYATVKLTKLENKSVYIRCFTKATILSICHISPIYICSLAVTIDISIIMFCYFKYSSKLLYPKSWLLRGILSNIALLLLYIIGTKKIVLYILVGLIFLVILLQFYEHYEETKKSIDNQHSQISLSENGKKSEQKHYTSDLIMDISNHNNTKEDFLYNEDTEQNFQNVKQVTKKSTKFTQNDDFKSGNHRAQTSKKRVRPFKKRNKQPDHLMIETIKEQDYEFNSQLSQTLN